MSIIVRNPDREIARLSEAMDRIFEGHNGHRVARLPLDIYSTDKEVIVTAAVPGVDPESIDITVEDGVLTIKGEIPERLEDVDYIFAERFHGTFSRALKLNVAVEVDNIEATFENGVLTLVLPKAEEAQPKVIKVEAK
jgi:HSP20 family protein